MKSLTVYILSFCAILGLISFELRKNDLNLEELGVIDTSVPNPKCNCLEFIRNERELKPEYEINGLYDLREVLKADGYRIRKYPKKGDVIIISTSFDKKKFPKGKAGIIYEVLEDREPEKVQFRSVKLHSGNKFAQGNCENVEISEFLPIDVYAKKGLVTLWRKE